MKDRFSDGASRYCPVRFIDQEVHNRQRDGLWMNYPNWKNVWTGETDCHYVILRGKHKAGRLYI